MIYEIVELSTVKGTPNTYVLVEFWLTQAAKDAEEPCFLREEFVLSLAAVGSRAVTDEQGRFKLASGEFLTVDEIAERIKLNGSVDLVKETFERNPKHDLVATIENYMAKAIANGWSGDHTRDASKPFFVKGKLRKQDVNKTQPFDRDVSDPRSVLKHKDLKDLVKPKKRKT